MPKIEYQNGNRFVVSSKAKMPSSCMGNYRRIAIIETDGTMPKIISDRPNYVREIVRIWEKLNCGTSSRCAFVVALRQAIELTKGE